MPSIHFVSHDGTHTSVDVPSGTSVMRAAVNEGVEAILAECGGAAACGTCHVYIAQNWMAKLVPPDASELSMLECVSEPMPNSRLSCQVLVTEELDGLEVNLPASQF